MCAFLSPNLPIFGEKVVFPPPGTGVVLSAGEFIDLFQERRWGWVEGQMTFPFLLFS